MPDTMIISGTTRGIGRALCEHFKRWHIIPANRPEWDVTDRVASESNMRDAFFNDNQHVLVNNAGAAVMKAAMLTTDADIRRIFDVNVFAMFHMSRLFAKQVVKYGVKNARIINVSSCAVPLCIEGEAAYAASKAAVEQLTRQLAKEFARYNMTVNCVAPNPTDGGGLIDKVPEESIEAVLQQGAIPRRCTVDDIANVCEFFIRPESNMVTGQTIYLGGVW